MLHLFFVDSSKVVDCRVNSPERPCGRFRAMLDVGGDGLVFGGDETTGGNCLTLGDVILALAASLDLLQVIVNEASITLHLLLNLVRADNLQQRLLAGLAILNAPVDSLVQLLLNLGFVSGLELVSILVHILKGLVILPKPLGDMIYAVLVVESSDVLFRSIDAGHLALLARLHLRLRLCFASVLNLLQVLVHQVGGLHALRSRVRAQRGDQVRVSLAITDEDSCSCQMDSKAHIAAAGQHAR
mmetsp:Transcript_39177/g.108968  ORF Transcript_39177/g.108968 Transcript_39177/m.108968 type:complete len:243 (-) Transcript_39177:16-744(-)